MYKKVFQIMFIAFIFTNLSAKTFKVVENSYVSVDGKRFKLFSKGISIKAKFKICIKSGKLLQYDGNKASKYYTKNDNCIKIERRTLIDKFKAFIHSFIAYANYIVNNTSARRGITNTKKCILEVDTHKKYFIIPASKEELAQYDIAYPSKETVNKNFFYKGEKDKKGFYLPTKDIFDGMYVIITGNHGNMIKCYLKKKRR